ncbi:gliding motility lipoprotein GldB [Imtechella halotolerans]|uniref:Gliding motility membrane lipoprotein n=1 Tax=Imtechella halotolerans K1 TaxID=946077 RepID=I0WKL0_9FLAO|nr:gliding motility lipoprotein GldB [Imtechella halotolerans]EID76926.1 gliding motility membrane lipoprotein [Imtechella halotolerans K1]WMQ62514.1 gliding motility lipoprotein GldB [Imtechella halotolerans]
MLKNIVGIVLIFSLFACKNDKSTTPDVSKIPIETRVIRFEKLFFESSPEKLPQLKERYPYFFPKQYSDSIWYTRMSDTLQLELYSEVQKVFPDFKEEVDQIESIFKYTKFYFPEFNVPTVVTLTSDVDYQMRTVYADSLLLIALDTYLGSDHRFYQGIQEYIRKSFIKEQLPVNVVEAIGKKLIPYQQERTLLDFMVFYGKQLYLKELLLPEGKPSQYLNYTPQELDWVMENESEIWRYFVERNLLFDTDSKLLNRFITPAPFSKFYLELDNESPGSVGQYVGWQIVRSYMKNNDVPLQVMLHQNSQIIFNKSHYKPKR